MSVPVLLQVLRYYRLQYYSTVVLILHVQAHVARQLYFERYMCAHTRVIFFITILYYSSICRCLSKKKSAKQDTYNNLTFIIHKERLPGLCIVCRKEFGGEGKKGKFSCLVVLVCVARWLLQNHCRWWSKYE